MPTTPLYPIFRKRIGDAFEQLIKKQITPWVFMTARHPFQITTFDGRQIAYQGIEFNGTPREVFWSEYIEPFLEHLCVSEIEAAVSMCKERDVDARLLLPQIQSLLITQIKAVYKHMADMDQNLLGKGHPHRVPRRSVQLEVQRMKEFVSDRIQAELHIWKPRQGGVPRLV